jgi:hypothetical protein
MAKFLRTEFFSAPRMMPVEGPLGVFARTSTAQSQGMVSPVLGYHAGFRQKLHLSLVYKFPEPALSKRGASGRTMHALRSEEHQGPQSGEIRHSDTERAAAVDTGSWPSPAEVCRQAAAGDELSTLTERRLR